MSRKRKQPRPYIMRGAARPSAARPTVLDPPDRRMAANPEPNKLSVEQLARLASASITDPRLRAIDRCFQRWAITHGDREAVPGWAMLDLGVRTSSDKPLPLDDAESLIIDAAIRTAPAWAEKFIRLWYAAELSAQDMQIALKIGTRDAVYGERKIVLAYFLGRLVEAGIEFPTSRVS